VVAFVVDNSVVVSWLYAGQATDYTERVLESSGTSTLHTSFIWPAEFANAATVMVKRGLLSDELGSAMIRMADTLGLVVDRTPTDLRVLYQVSRRYGLSAYDASYLELAMRLNIPLATRDTALIKASQSLDLFLV
jgi:predicted nucleic acid-binding protein